MREIEEEVRRAIKKNGEFCPAFDEMIYYKWYCFFKREDAELLKVPVINKFDQVRKTHINVVISIMRGQQTDYERYLRMKQKIYNPHLQNKNKQGKKK